VTDHRINFSAHNLSDFVQGDIEALLDALHAEDQAERLAQMEQG
jgi:peptide chain release factor 1